jgi:UDP-glucose 4-epimerase
VRAILLAFESKYSGRAIVGAGLSVSVLEMVQTVREVTGAELPMEHVAAPAGEMPAVIADISASAETIGFTPAISLADGLATAWKYFSELDLKATT